MLPQVPWSGGVGLLNAVFSSCWDGGASIQCYPKLIRPLVEARRQVAAASILVGSIFRMEHVKRPQKVGMGPERGI